MNTQAQERIGVDANAQGKPRGCRSGGTKSVWGPMNIGLMVLGFVFFWPVGLVLLFWMLNGNHVTELPGAVRSKLQSLSGLSGLQSWRRAGPMASGNEIFDEYQQTQLDRVEEIKAEVRDRWNRFSQFKSEENRRAAKSEFERFMSKSTPEQ